MAKAQSAATSTKHQESEDYGFCGFNGMQTVCKELKITSGAVYKKLSALKSPEEQFIYLFSLLDKVKIYSVYAKGKNDSAALTLRKKGNKYYAAGDTKTAVDYYSMALSMATNDSSEMPMAIGNKSACYFDLDHPRAVDTHIGIVECNMRDLYPDKSWNKLRERLQSVHRKLVPSHVAAPIRNTVLYNYLKGNCWEWERSSSIIAQPILDFAAMSTETFTKIEARVAHGNNVKVPGLSMTVKLEYSDALGRHLVAARQINPGDVIVRAHMSAAALYAQKYEFSHCSYCLRFGHQLVPCSLCPHERYCDMACMEMARDAYHWALCGVAGSLNFGTNVSHTKLMLAIRLLMGHLGTHRGKMYDFVKEVSKYEAESSGSKIKGLNKKGVFDECEFRTVYFMWSDASLLPEEMRQSLAISCAYAMQVITEHPYFFSPERNLDKNKMAEMKKVLTSLLFRILVGLEWNCYETFDHLFYLSRKRIDKAAPFVAKTQVRPIGLFYNSLLGLFNHACYSNCVYNEQMNGIVLVRALKTIKIGEQLTIPYFDYWATSRPRKAALYRHMGGFKCTCFACAHALDSKTPVYLRELHLSPRCPKCKDRKSARPDQEVVNCSKCKISIRVDRVRDLLVSYMVYMRHWSCNLPLSNVDRLTTIFESLQEIEEMALPHSCWEVHRLRYSILNAIAAGDKSYVRPVMISDPKRELALLEELELVPDHVWEEIS